MVTRALEQIEAAAREANCEFVWGLLDGSETQSKVMLYHQETFYLTGEDSREIEPKWRPTPAPHDRPGALEETYDLGT